MIFSNYLETKTGLMELNKHEQTAHTFIFQHGNLRDAVLYSVNHKS
jgi:hypothetical protein